jgi:hypothetical protein
MQWYALYATPKAPKKDFSATMLRLVTLHMNKKKCLRQNLNILDKPENFDEPFYN